MSVSIKKWYSVVFLDIVVLTLLFFLKRVADIFLSVTPDCVFNRIGIICPACGGTRCVREFGAGNFAASFRYNQFFFVVGIYLIVVVILLNLAYLFKLSFAKKMLGIIANTKVVIMMSICFAVFGIIRNVI